MHFKPFSQIVAMLKFTDIVINKNVLKCIYFGPNIKTNVETRGFSVTALTLWNSALSL